MSGSSEKFTTSAGCPFTTFFDWVPEAPNEEVTEMFLPDDVCSNAEMSLA